MSQIKRSIFLLHRLHALKIVVPKFNCERNFTSSTSSSSSILSKIYNVKDNMVEKTPITAQLWQMRKNNQETEEEKSNINTAEPIVIIKTPADSRLSVRYNFKSDINLRDLYIDPVGNVMIGKLFEDLDALAGNIAYVHADDNNPTTKRLNLVTASVDKIVQKKPIHIDNDLVLTGQLEWVGRSSMVVTMEVHLADMIEASKPDITDTTTVDSNTLFYNSKSKVLSCHFTYVARNKITEKAAQVNQLKPITAAEIFCFNERQRLHEYHRNSKSTQHTHSANIEMLEQLMEAGSAIEDMPALAHPNAVLMKSTGLENSLICQPQNVNMSGKVFGGFIMHRAYDLALATCYCFAGSYPVFIESDKISFRRPVAIGDLLRLKSRVVFTSDDPIKPRVVIEVSCQVVKPEQASSFISNTFSFVFGFNKNVALRKVLPVTTEEAKALINGSRSI